MPIKFKPEWITQGADQEMVDFAQKQGQILVDKGVTNTQFRNVYGEIKRIQSTGFDRERSHFYLLQPKMAYAVGRQKESTIKEGLKILEGIIRDSSPLVKNKEQYDNFCNLFESIIAYHKAFGGKD